MVIASHAIFCAYGFWLPNDPRGSWSDFVGAWELVLAGGKATKVDTRESVAHVPHDRAARLAAKRALKFPPVEFTGEQALAISRGFAEAADESGYRLYACSILPAHVHMVIGRHRTDVKRVVGHLKVRSTQELDERGLHPLTGYVGWNRRVPSPWARKGWEVYLNTPWEVRRAIRYVENNPVKEGKRRQVWSFVTAFAL